MRNVPRRIVITSILAFVVIGTLLALSLTTALSAPPIEAAQTIRILPKVTFTLKTPIFTLIPPKRTLIIVTFVKLPSNTPTFTPTNPPTAQ